MRATGLGVLLAVLALAGGASAGTFIADELLEALPYAQTWPEAIRNSPLPGGALPAPGQPDVPALPWPGAQLPHLRTDPRVDAPLDEAAPASLAPDRAADAALAAGERATAAPQLAPNAPAMPDAPAAVAAAREAWDALPLWGPYDTLWYARGGDAAHVTAGREGHDAPALAAAPPPASVAERTSAALIRTTAAAAPASSPQALADAAPGRVLAAATLAAPSPAGTGAAPLLLAVGAGAALLALARALALSHRIPPSRLLEQPTRRRIHEAIAAEPGIRVGTLQARLGLNYNTVLRHVRRLEDGGLVEGAGQGQKRWFVAGAHSPADQRAARAVAGAAAPRILAHLRQRGAAEVRQLRAELGLPRSTASDAVARLAAAGLVAVERRGARVRVVLAAP